MKKLLISSLAICLALHASAQYRTSALRTTAPRHGQRATYETYTGIRIGAMSSSISADNRELDADRPKTGLSLGIVRGVQLSPTVPLYFEAGLSYLEKGGKGYDAENVKYTYSLNYLAIPLLIKYKIAMDYDLSFQPFFGGYLAYGIAGKYKYYGNGKHAHYTCSSYSDDAFKHFDGGLKIGCGLAIQMFYAEVGYDFGLANIEHDDFDRAHNGTVYANIGVNF